MDLKRISVVIEADGFRLHDKRSGIEPGTALEARYEVSSGWMTKEIAFEADPPTFFHPFRRAMFVYTGERPTRVLVRIAGSTNPMEEISNRAVFYQQGNFSSYPVFDDPIWDRGNYADFFFGSSAPLPPPPPSYPPSEPFMPSAPESFGGMAEPPPAFQERSAAAPEPTPILEDPEPTTSAVGGLSGAEFGAAAGSAASDAASSEPNAY